MGANQSGRVDKTFYGDEGKFLNNNVYWLGYCMYLIVSWKVFCSQSCM